MDIKEWKHYRNTKVIETEKLNQKQIEKTLGIDINLANDIKQGLYGHQIKEWNRELRKEEIRRKMNPFTPLSCIPNIIEIWKPRKRKNRKT